MITKVTTAADITSRLVVNGFIDDSDTGMYWCTGILEDGSTLQTHSSELLVEEQYIYEGLFPCIDNLFLKHSELKCIPLTGTVTSTEVIYWSYLPRMRRESRGKVIGAGVHIYYMYV